MHEVAVRAPPDGLVEQADYTAQVPGCEARVVVTAARGRSPHAQAPARAYRVPLCGFASIGDSKTMKSTQAPAFPHCASCGALAGP